MVLSPAEARYQQITKTITYSAVVLPVVSFALVPNMSLSLIAFGGSLGLLHIARRRNQNVAEFILQREKTEHKRYIQELFLQKQRAVRESIRKEQEKIAQQLEERLRQKRQLRDAKHAARLKRRADTGDNFWNTPMAHDEISLNFS